MIRFPVDLVLVILRTDALLKPMSYLVDRYNCEPNKKRMRSNNFPILAGLVPRRIKAR